MNKETIIYHGSEEEIKVPVLERGNVNNDYGQGFYCTEEYDKAATWALKRKSNGYVNKYLLKASKLKVFDFSELKENMILHWAAVIFKHREARLDGLLAQNNRDFLIEHFNLDLSGYDIVKGYRADDQYFRLARLFLTDQITIRALANAFTAGRLGEQIVLMSHRAFACLEFQGAKQVSESQGFISYRAMTEVANREVREQLESDIAQRKAALKNRGGAVAPILSEIIRSYLQNQQTDFDKFAKDEA
ncbi:MAG: DUF3990 domain-containing protein [Succinivibrio sp.]|jgi:hypothetical protein|nr:DUF3990 domain-containing protein [Succinivibrio sp.]